MNVYKFTIVGFLEVKNEEEAKTLIGDLVGDIYEEEKVSHLKIVLDLPPYVISRGIEPPPATPEMKL